MPRALQPTGGGVLMPRINFGDRLKKIAGWASWVLAPILWYLNYTHPEFFEPLWRPVCAVAFGVGGCVAIWMARRYPSPAGAVVGAILGIVSVAIALILAVGVYKCGVDFRGCKWNRDRTVSGLGFPYSWFPEPALQLRG